MAKKRKTQEKNKCVGSTLDSLLEDTGELWEVRLSVQMNIFAEQLKKLYAAISELAADMRSDPKEIGDSQVASKTKKPRSSKKTEDWKPEDLYSLDFSLAKLILPRLKAFREARTNLIADKNNYNAELDAMIEAFELVVSDGYWLAKEDTLKEVVDKGLLLFAKNYRALWY